jgi:cytosine/adenosine deaminase-related metal-dependent hydrolase
MNASKIVAMDKPNNRLSTAEIFFLSTLGRAEVLSIDDVVGNFKPGKHFDGLIVTLENVRKWMFLMKLLKQTICIKCYRGSFLLVMIEILVRSLSMES